MHASLKIRGLTAGLLLPWVFPAVLSIPKQLIVLIWYRYRRCYCCDDEARSITW